MPPAPTLPRTEAYPDRNPSATRFHFSSAGIDPLGAHARPIKPLPRRSKLPRMGERPVGMSVTGTSGPAPVLHAELLTGAQPQVRDGESPSVPVSSPSLRRLRGEVFRAPREGALEPRRRVVSGSFGSFEGGVGRFDERAYRLGPRTILETVSEEDEEENVTENGTVQDTVTTPTKTPIKTPVKTPLKKAHKKSAKDSKKPDLFKGKPWLKR